MIRYKNKIIDQPMKKHISIILAMAVGAALLAACTPGAFAQSIGVNFTSDGNDSGIAGVNNAATNTDSSMLPTDLAGAAPYAQLNWDNLGKYGGVNPAVLTLSLIHISEPTRLG